MFIGLNFPTQKSLRHKMDTNFTILCYQVTSSLYWFWYIVNTHFMLQARDAIAAGSIVEGWKHARTARTLSRLAFILWTLMFSSLIIIVIISANIWSWIDWQPLLLLFILLLYTVFRICKVINYLHCICLIIFTLNQFCDK